MHLCWSVRKEEQNMIMRLVLPRYEKVHFLSGICSLFLRKEDEVHYIGGAEILPPPLEGEREAYCIRMLDGVHAERARKELIEHNLRLVVYIAKKFDNTGVGVEDLISIGTIGLIKGMPDRWLSVWIQQKFDPFQNPFHQIKPPPSKKHKNDQGQTPYSGFQPHGASPQIPLIWLQNYPGRRR